jgi:hypothetical protein
LGSMLAGEVYTSYTTLERDAGCIYSPYKAKEREKRTPFFSITFSMCE